MPTVTATPSPPDATVVLSGSGFVGPVTVTRTAGGVSQTVRGGVNLPTPDGTFTLVDGEAPFDVDLIYSVTDPGPPETITAAPTVVLASASGWLSHPGYVDLRVRVADETVDDWSYAGRSVAHNVVNRADPVITAQPTDRGSGTLTFRVTAGDLDALVRLFADGWPVLYRGTCSNVPDRWQLVESYRTRVASRGTGTREVTAQFRVVNRPADDPYVVTPWRLMDVDAMFGTLAEVDAAYGTLSEVDAGPPV